MERKHTPKIVSTARMLRKNMTREEKHLWYDFLRQCPGRFTRQKILGNYIADFYSAQAKLVIELDGSQHYSKKGQQADAVRTTFLEQYGLQILRISNLEIDRNFQNVCEYILHIVNEKIKAESDE